MKYQDPHIEVEGFFRFWESRKGKLDEEWGVVDKLRSIYGYVDDHERENVDFDLLYHIARILLMRKDYLKQHGNVDFLEFVELFTDCPVKSFMAKPWLATELDKKDLRVIFVEKDGAEKKVPVEEEILEYLAGRFFVGMGLLYRSKPDSRLRGALPDDKELRNWVFDILEEGGSGYVEHLRLGAALLLAKMRKHKGYDRCVWAEKDDGRDLTLVYPRRDLFTSLIRKIMGTPEK